MAKFKVSGLLELQKEIAKISEMDNGALAKQMLREGSKNVADTWRQETEKRHKLKGYMLRGIKSTNPKKNRIGRYTVTYPMGEEYRVRRGNATIVRDAEKAFYLHYGYINPRNGKFYHGDRWVEVVDKTAEPLVDKTMQAIWDKWLKDNQK